MVSQQPEPIAIVGSACRFAGGADSPSKLWELLRNPRDLLKEIPNERFNPNGYYHKDGSHHGTTNVRHAYLLDEDLRLFDAKFFNLSNHEADSIDPQQRFLLETVYESMESAGLTIEGLRGSDTAVYVGAMAVDYQDLINRDMNNIPTYFATGVARSILSNRISYFFDWHGPCMTIDTACSSSMIAVHQGVQALRANDSQVAVACGAELMLGPEVFVGESKMNLLSPTGRSRMWDADADGYARGDGVASIVMKKLSNAIADGDHIECIIRETGVNQDGRGNGGLTVPSSEAQAALIRQTYAKAGLNMSDPRDWPQFFESHGTGTKVGDPKEAAAIKGCFSGRSASHEPLYVGSIKTIIGHTEGTAGVAGVLKGSLALQHSTIPPNMLFNNLNPSIEPFYDGLLVPTEPKPWPKIPDGVSRRISVNSFGFGGTNAHAILENYQPAETSTSNGGAENSLLPFRPFTFSAVSETSLVALLRSYSEFLKKNKSVDLRDLAWTLQSRRSVFPLKTAFAANNVDRLISKIDNKLTDLNTTPIGIRSNPGEPHVLGVFTGQGAQWATMGARLLLSSTFVQRRVRDLEDSLSTLPETERPSWKISGEILKDSKTSRMGEAELSQPLCTAIQIVMVDMLKSAGIKFKAVIGHSSGEIAAAYAAGFISARDAIRIAYFRGWYAKLAGGPKGQKGAMLAVGTSWEDAQELAELPAFKGRLTVAAHNSSASVTMSGDADAIAHAKDVFDEEKKFARLLKVDTAYHCHHMFPCKDPYIKAIRACQVKVNRDHLDTCVWYSSVNGGKAMKGDEQLEDIYWAQNMVNPVMFMEACASAVKLDINFALEVGPHPALKGPATQNISDYQQGLPYIGVLSRGDDDLEAFVEALGVIWTHMGGSAVDFESLDKVMSTGAPQKLLTGLPKYTWDRSRAHWHESKRSQRFRAHPEGFHELLGTMSPDSTDGDHRWSNLLKPSEISWLDGHQLQGQTVFPAAGYVAMALEAANKLAKGRKVNLLEIHNLALDKAITFEDDANFAVETRVTLTAISSTRQNQEVQTADFSCYSCPATGSGAMELMASGSVKVIYGEPSPTALLSTRREDSTMSAVDADRFYTNLVELGYGYKDFFRTMSSLKRKLDQASASLMTYDYRETEDVLMVHPTYLDVAFQVLLLAQSMPGDQRAWSLHIPTSIKCIRVNPHLCNELPLSGTMLPVEADLDPRARYTMCGNLEILSQDGQTALLQVEELRFAPFAPATAADDRSLFFYTKHELSTPDGAIAMGTDRASAEEIEFAIICERVSYYYLKKWISEVSDEEWKKGEWHHQCLRDATKHKLSVIESGRHPYIRKGWANDTDEEIRSLINENSLKCIDLRLLAAAGDRIPDVVRGKTTMLEHMLKDDMLDLIYKKGIGFEKFNSYLAKMLKQITHRYPHMKIFEIGAGTGGATKTVLEELNGTFSSYTYTDVSTGFFEKASELFKSFSDKMIFKAFDVEKPPTLQGYEEHSYDVVVASNVLHATKSLKITMENTRRLLKPGGYLILLEVTNNWSLRIGNLTCGLPGWWVGRDDGRKNAPTITPAGWNDLLRKSGFSGVDAITPERDGMTWPYSVIVAQAIDDRVSFLRKPLSAPSSSEIEELVIVGSKSLKTSVLSAELAHLLDRYCGKVTILEDLPTPADGIGPMSTFINLIDLDEPVFRGLDTAKMDGLKQLFELSRTILWVTKNALTENPYHMASIGFGRVITHEQTHLRLQFLDVPSEEDDVSRVIAESVLRLHATERWAEDTGDWSKTLLWTTEPELFYEKGQIMIPRLLSNEEQNARLSSQRRQVKRAVNPQISIVEISPSAKDTFTLRENLSEDHASADRLVHCRQSILSAISAAPDTFLNLSIDSKQSANNTVISLSGSNSSIKAPLAELPINVHGAESSELLSAVAAELLTTRLSMELLPNSVLLVHEPDQNPYFASALDRLASEKGIEVVHSTASLEDKNSARIHIRRGESEHMIKTKISARLTHFLDLSINGPAKDVGLRIHKLLPSTCKQIQISTLFRNQSSLPKYYDCDHSQLLEEALTRAKTAIVGKRSSLTHGLSQISDSATARSPLDVIDWMTDSSVVVEVEPLDSAALFSPDKTYLLVGLGGDMGQSLCEWMARNGAGAVVLTSRRPNVDLKWLDSFRNSATIVKALPMDVTKKEDVRRIVDEINATLPPIGGIANGAMVLQDSMFADMSLDSMEKVMNPKIQGTNNLNEVFYDTELEFFVLFSSMASIIGNAGQSNYAVGCQYLAGLAAQRRKRGFAASVFDIGRVVGIGYVDRASQLVRDQLDKFGFMPISESDLHQMFAETMRVGRVKGDLLPVITTGMRTVRDDEEMKPPWADDPRFSHRIIEAKQEQIFIGGKKAALPVGAQLEAARTRKEALEILKDCFAAKLQVILQLPAEQLGYDVPLTELGIDSLVAVEVRTWFLKELKTDMPVLKVLSGGSVDDLCAQALNKLPTKYVPSSDAVDPGESKRSPPVPEAKPKETTSARQPVLSQSLSSSDISPTASSPAQLDSQSSISDPTRASDDEVKNASSTKAKPVFEKTEQISLAQSRFWFLKLLLEDQTTFNVTFYYKVTGNLRVHDLERALRLVSQRHEGLRTSFVGDKNEPDLAYQGVLKNSNLVLERKSIIHEDEVVTEYNAIKNHVFDLESGQLLRVVLLTLSPSAHFLLFNYHHIVMDGTSYSIFIADLEKAYSRQSLGPAPRQFPDFSKSQRLSLEKGTMKNELEFWKGVFPDPPPVLPLLPMARVNSRVPMKTFDINQIEYTLDPALSDKVKQMSKAQRSTNFHLYLAIFKALLFRFVEVTDMTIGIADANRNDDDVMNTIGLFLNLLPLRFQYKPNQTFGDAVVEARNKTYAALGYSRLPFDVLLKELNAPRSSLFSPIFQAFFDYRQGVRQKQSFGDLDFEGVAAHPGRTAYDISLDITESEVGTLIFFKTQRSLYDLPATKFLLNTYLRLLEASCQDMSLTFERPSLYDERELKNALTVGRGPDMRSDWPETLPHRIDQIVSKRKGSLAVKDGLGHYLTYADLSDRVEAIAQALQKQGVNEGSRVLVFQQAASDWPCSLLAIMRVGGVYVPLDLRNPIERLAGIAQDCQPSAILADNTTLSDARMLNTSETKIVNVSSIKGKASGKIQNRAKADSQAAILYTSGSTGKPKGVIIKHSGLRNEIEGYTKMWKLGAERVLQQSAFTFNHSSDQIFTALVNGGMIYIVPWDKRGDPLEVTKIILEEDITYTKATPSEYLLWLEHGFSNLKKTSQWRFAFGGGEQVPSTVTKGFSALNLPQLCFFNSYGPAEITISSTKMKVPYHEDLSQSRIACGFSLPNYVVYILDEQLKPVPTGIPGEVVIGGAGVCLGYLSNEELTDRHFVHNPYATSDDIAKGWTRMYRTGDIGHLQSDGALVFHNRIADDTQVKIRGIRIELGDIESNIVSASKGSLREAVVTLHEGDPEFLVAHVVFKPHHGIHNTDEYLRQLLSHLPLPQYMIPVMAIPLDRMLLNNHSKIDRKAIKALPLLPHRLPSSEDVELTGTMIQLKNIWEDVLHNKQLNFEITPSTSFFNVGGNSLLIVRLQSRIRDTFSIVIRLVELLASNTLTEMAYKIEAGLAVEAIDWEKEIALPDINSLPVKATKPIATDDKTILLTGASGFLSKWILPRLVNNKHVAKIYCIGIRLKGNQNPRKLPISSPKIVVYTGDLSEPWLGLSQATFWQLAGEVDAILHAGASRSFWDNYHTLRASNVTPTKMLVKLAAARGVPVHYISSAGVLLLPAEKSREDKRKGGSMAAHSPPTDGSNGYVASRWASEQILERVATSGLSTTIHRFVSPASKVPREEKINVLDEFVRFAHRSHTAPELEGWKGSFDMIASDEAAGKLTHALLNPSIGVGKAIFLHHVCSVKIDVDEMREHIEERVRGYGYEGMPALKWVGHIKPLGFGYFFASQDITLSEKTGERGKGEVLKSKR
ncbi:MAG: putative Hybrid PKS-NRPS biosynthetic cluster [Bathelium mastoideum]|nr:MAG: putative Hybrid PKS-NRPS biosynthetic cluster [Bathelium mastoideum]